MKKLIEIAPPLSEILQGDRLSFAPRSGEAITLVPEGDPNVKRPDFLTDKRL